MTYFILFILVIALAEIKARKRFLKKHGIPYQAKKVGEYPYNQFVEECGPPLHWKLKPNWADANMHINSLGLRSPEPQTGRRKIWVVGESELFGAKLHDEGRIWFKTLQIKLDAAGHDVQVMNASIIGYNGRQTAEAVLTLPVEKDDIVLLRPNQNDVSLAYINGSDWSPGTSWPIGFVHKLQRHKAWYFKLLDLSCFGTMLRRRSSQDAARAKAFQPKPGFQWEALVEYETDEMTRMTEYVASKGAQVVFFGIAPSYEPEIAPEDEPKLAAIQSNWRGFVEGWCQYQFDIVDKVSGPLSPKYDAPILRIDKHIWNHPLRYQLFLDLMHFNEAGHDVLAEALFVELEAAGLLTKETA